MSKDKFPVMLVSPMKELGRINFPCIAQTKMDGMRVIIVVDNGEITAYSRNGKKLIGLEDHFIPIIAHNNIVYDGELTVVGGEEGDRLRPILDRKTGNGICHKAVESVNTISAEEISRIRLTLWDIIPLEAFKAKVDPTPYHVRLDKLHSMQKHNLFSVVETWVVKDLEQAQGLFQDLLSRGEEGIILKNTDHPWEAKRSKQCVKMKAELEMDLKIIGFAEGLGKNSGMTGAIQCESFDGKIKVDVGTGMNDATRISIWEKRDSLIGSVVEVKYNEVIQAKTDKSASLYLPVFVELRVDKDVA